MMGTSCAFATITVAPASSSSGLLPFRNWLNLRRSRFEPLNGSGVPAQATLASALLDGLQARHIELVLMYGSLEIKRHGVVHRCLLDPVMLSVVKHLLAQHHVLQLQQRQLQQQLQEELVVTRLLAQRKQSALEVQQHARVAEALVQ
jgi:hypothetical protein